MKITLSCNTSWGLLHFRKNIIKYFVQQGYEVHTISPLDLKHTNELEKLGCSCHNWNVNSKGIHPLEDLKSLYHIRQTYKEIKPDLAIHFTIKANIWGTLAAASLRIPVLAVTTGLGYTFLNPGMVSLIAQKLYKFSFKFAKEIWFLNQDDVDVFTSNNLVPPIKAFLLPGEGVNTNKFVFQRIPHLENSTPLHFLLIGRILRDKGIFEYITATKKIHIEHPHIRFSILGPIWKENPAAIQEDEFLELIKDSPIEYLGTNTDVSRIISQADIMVLPSYREGVPLTLLEGASMGRPIVATNVPGCKDVVKHEENGFLCEARSSIALEESLLRIINLDQSELEKMCYKSRELCENKFSDKNIIKHYREFLSRHF